MRSRNTKTGHRLTLILLCKVGVCVCLQCNCRTTSADLLRRHLSKEHGQRRADMDIHRGKAWKEVSLQSWSQNGKREFWIVESNVDQTPAQDSDRSPRRQCRLAQVHSAERDRAAMHDRVCGHRVRPNADRALATHHYAIGRLIIQVRVLGCFFNVNVLQAGGHGACLRSATRAGRASAGVVGR